jgi:hypothetical protein
MGTLIAQCKGMAAPLKHLGIGRAVPPYSVPPRLDGGILSTPQSRDSCTLLVGCGE